MIKKVPVIALLALSGLIFATLAFNTSSSQQSLQRVNQGTGTCFYRVGQSFMAFLVGDQASPYLQRDFSTSTEECFGEVLTQLREYKIKTWEETEKKLNDLANSVYWFHNSLKSGTSRFSRSEEDNGDQLKKVLTRYQSVETLMDGLQAELNQRASESLSQVTTYKYILYFLFSLGFVGGLVLLVLELRKAKRLKVYEERIDSVFSQESVDLNQVDSLLQRYIHISEDQKLNNYFENYLKVVERQRPQPEEQSSSRRDEKNWGEGLDALRVEDIFSKVVTINSKDLFVHGIALKVEVEDDINVLGKEEELTQVFHLVLKKAITSHHELGEERKILFKASSLGGLVTIDFESSGAGFTEGEFTVDADITGPDLRICEELIKSCEGQVAFRNLSNEEGETLGGQVRIVLKREAEKELPAATLPHKTIKVIKGQKSEILNRLSQGLS